MSKKEREIYQSEMDFKKSFCYCSNLSKDDIISYKPVLRMGMDFRGQVWKRVWKMIFFGLK